jgi:hypothetical protein
MPPRMMGDVNGGRIDAALLKQWGLIEMHGITLFVT